MVDRNAPQALPRAPDEYQRQNEQEARDIVGRSLDQTLRRVNEIKAELEDLAGAGALLAANNLDDLADVATARTNLELVPGTHVQAQSAILSDLAGLTQATDRLMYFDSATTAALASFTAAGRSMVGAADAAAQTALLNPFTTLLKGLVPSGGSATTFLRGDATFQSVISSVAIQAFTASGTYTPTTGMKYCVVIASGAGGGGGGADGSDASSSAAGGGGGAGATVIGLYSAATIGANQTITINAAGTAGADTGGNGGDGGSTTFGSLITALGGTGGTGSVDAFLNSHPGSPGGTASGSSGGSLKIAGGDGHHGMSSFQTYILVSGGNGGASLWGGGGRGGFNRTTGTGVSEAGHSGVCYGAGGGGGVTANTTTGVVGGAGASGAVLVIEFV